MSTRRLRARRTSGLTAAPAAVSDLTCHIVVGLEARSFRELLIRERVAHARLGRRVIARVEDVLDALDRLAGAVMQMAPVSQIQDEPQPEQELEEEESVDAVLAALGRERVA
jgi:hypothetical protein